MIFCKNFISRSRGFHPRTQWSEGIFNCYYIFVQIRAKNSRNFWKVINFLILLYGFLQISWKFFYLRGLRPSNPHYTLPILYSLFSNYQKLWPGENLKHSEQSAFFPQNFSVIFQIFIIFNRYFWKITPNFMALPNSKISFHPRGIGSQTKNSTQTDFTSGFHTNEK